MIYYYHNNGKYTAFGTGHHMYVDFTTEDSDRFQSKHDSFRKENMIGRPGNVFKCPFVSTEELLTILFDNFLTKESKSRATKYGVSEEQVNAYIAARGDEN